MTLTVEPSSVLPPPSKPVHARRSEPAPRATAPTSHPGTYALLAVWLLAALVGFALGIYGFGPALQDRSQRELLRDLRTRIGQAANEASGLAGVTVASRAPELGSPVGILEIGALRQQQAVVEGVSASQTNLGPGHVPGTAGLGQPGNSVIVGRRSAMGGSFGNIASIHGGDPIVVSTTQGVSVYVVESVRHVTLGAPPEGSSGGALLALDALYGPSKHDKLTLVTSASIWPGNKNRAVVVTAKLNGAPYAPTLQGALSDRQMGFVGEHGARAAALLVVLAYGMTLGAAVVLYRQMRPKIAYLLTVGPVVAMTVIAAETLVRLLPAWS